MEDVQKAFNKLVSFVTVQAKKKRVEYDEEHTTWGNFNDSFSHGSDVADSDTAEAAEKVLKEVQEILNHSHESSESDK